MNTNTTEITETKSFLEWYSKEKEQGLIDVKFFPRDAQSASEESFFAEVNTMLKAEATDDPEFF